MELAVTAACATEHLELVRRLGANRVVDYTAGDFTRDEQRYDIVFDAHGTPSYFACRKLLKPGGRYTSAGGGRFGMNLPWHCSDRSSVTSGLCSRSPRSMRRWSSTSRRSWLRAASRRSIDRTYALNEIVAAYHHAQSGDKLGNVVLELTPDK
jgi:NADPH:quinone reductase-like Zn-dependent oxidoreductase